MEALPTREDLRTSGECRLLDTLIAMQPGRLDTLELRALYGPSKTDMRVKVLLQIIRMARRERLKL